MKKQITITVALVGICWLLSACSPTPKLITICKQTVPAGGGAFQFLWTQGSSGTPVPWASLSDTQCSTVNVAGQNAYNRFTETVPAGVTLTSITCDQGGVKFLGANETWAGADGTFNPGDDTVALDIGNTNITCTFVNQLPACCGNIFNANTGQGGGAIDPVWQVDGGPAYITSAEPGWMGLPSAQWIQPAASSAPVPAAEGTFSYVSTFRVDGCASGRVELIGSFAADNNAMAFLDGIAIAGASCPGPVCFNTPQAPVPINVPSIAPGSHTLQIDVNNLGGVSGLIVNAQVRRVCP